RARKWAPNRPLRWPWGLRPGRRGISRVHNAIAWRFRRNADRGRDEPRGGCPVEFHPCASRVADPACRLAERDSGAVRPISVRWRSCPRARTGARSSTRSIFRVAGDQGQEVDLAALPPAILAGPRRRLYAVDRGVTVRVQEVRRA